MEEGAVGVIVKAEEAALSLERPSFLKETNSLEGKALSINAFNVN